MKRCFSLFRGMILPRRTRTHIARSVSAGSKSAGCSRPPRGPTSYCTISISPVCLFPDHEHTARISPLYYFTTTTTIPHECPHWIPFDPYWILFDRPRYIIRLLTPLAYLPAASPGCPHHAPPFPLVQQASGWGQRPRATT